MADEHPCLAFDVTDELMEVLSSVHSIWRRYVALSV